MTSFQHGNHSHLSSDLWCVMCCCSQEQQVARLRRLQVGIARFGCAFSSRTPKQQCSNTRKIVVRMRRGKICSPRVYAYPLNLIHTSQKAAEEGLACGESGSGWVSVEQHTCTGKRKISCLSFYIL